MTNLKVVHKCIHCGCDIFYLYNRVGSCFVCKKPQTLATLDGFNSVPIDFILSKGVFARVTYHTEKTNTKEAEE